LIFLVEKQNGDIKKARICINGSTQREYMGLDEAASPTASTESIIISSVIDAKQHRDVMTADIPNAFVQTPLGAKAVGEQITMKIRGPLVDMLEELSPEVYSKFVVYKGPAKENKGTLCCDDYGPIWHVTVILTVLQEVLQGY
jgi:hypothetical protein